MPLPGQHGRGIKNVSDENDPQYGMGNGLEVFDVSDPAHPISLYSQFFGQGILSPTTCGNQFSAEIS